MHVLLAIINAIRLGVGLLRHAYHHPLDQPMTEDEVDRVLVAAASAPDVADARDWRNSIVDLMKILRLDSSLTARADLARELDYAGPGKVGSAEMNMWLHDAVMKKVAERCYAVPGT